MTGHRMYNAQVEITCQQADVGAQARAVCAKSSGEAASRSRAQNGERNREAESPVSFPPDRFALRRSRV